MASYEYIKMKEKHPEWIWPRSDSHMVLGIPGSEECFKTWVEPGNSFSPGLGSFGVSIWIYDHSENKFYIPEKMQIEQMKWRFLDGFIPIIISEYETGTSKIESRLFKQYDSAERSYMDTLILNIEAKKETFLSIYLVIRSFGPCGGFIGSIRMDENGKDIIINGFPLIVGNITMDNFSAVSYEQNKEDIGNLIIKKELPEKKESKDKNGWASGTAVYNISLKEGEGRVIYWDFPLYFPKALGGTLIPYIYPKNIPIEERERKTIEWWTNILKKVEITVPDQRFKEAFYATLAHMIMMIVGKNVRIQNSFYPLFWLRDGAYIINAIDKSGNTELGESACDIVIERDFLGGMGAEGDAPGIGIWVLVEHYKLTRNKEWLRKAYPSIIRKAELIEKMMRTTEPIYYLEVETVKYTTRYSPVQGLVCLPSKEGIIQGRMDWHIPIFWINCWSICGLKLAAFASRELGFEKRMEYFDNMAEELKKNIKKFLPDFGKNQRDVSCALWPTRALEGEILRPYYNWWWEKVRCPNGKYQPQFDWPYFELAQAHGYLFLGMRERVNLTIERFFSIQDVPGLYGYNEGKGSYCCIIDGEFGDMLGWRGWYPVYCNMPHNWVGAELFLLLRDILYHEENGTLVIGKGIPPSWIENKSVEIKVKNGITYFGKIDFEIDIKENKILFKYRGKCPPNGVLLDLPNRNKLFQFEGNEFETSIEIR
jgi:hypothetical protein